MRSKMNIKSKLKNKDGQAVLETVLVLPVILMLVFIGITLAMYIYAQIIVTMSSSNGARVGARIYHDTNLEMHEKELKIKTAALSMVEDSLPGEDRRYEINYDSGMLKVSVEYDFSVFLPFSNLVFDEGVVTIRSTSEYYIGEP